MSDSPKKRKLQSDGSNGNSSTGGSGKSPVFDAAGVRAFVSKEWGASVIPTLEEYIKVPNLSPTFDKQWASNGLQERVVDMFVKWVESKAVQGLTLEVVRLEGLTPLIFAEIAPTSDCPDDVGTVLMYGHLDKQPPFTGWHDGLSPYNPVVKEGKLYGRGGADDGYAIFCAVTAIRALQQQGCPHGRVVLIIEAAEESGSPHLPTHIKHLRDRIGRPNLIVCLDSGCGNYEQLWVTSSLRGMIVGTLKVEILSEGVHSGAASGIVPDSFRIARSLVSRLECPKTGRILPPALAVELSPQRLAKTKATAELLGRKGLIDIFPWATADCKPVQEDSMLELALNRWWRAQLAIVGAAGLPAIADSGNVLRPYTTLVLSLRLPPTLPKEDAIRAFTETLTKDPPYGARVTLDIKKAGAGWSAPDLAAWLDSALNDASQKFFGKPCMHQGEGGSIPFMGMLGKMFPEAQFCVTGVLGPNSNAHGPNEFLHIDFSMRLTCCVASILASHEEARVDSLLGKAIEKKSKLSSNVDVSDLVTPATEKMER